MGTMAESESIRTFISLEIPQMIKQEVEKLQNRLKRSGGDVRWAKPSGLHLTLKFLGRVPLPMIPSITDAIESVVTQSQFLKVRIRTVGAFPNLRSPRVIWVGLEGGEELIRLQAELETALSRLGFVPEDQPFKSHLTMGRVKSSRNRQALLSAIQEEEGWEGGDCELNEVHLMKSELHANGSVYTPLWSRIIGR